MRIYTSLKFLLMIFLGIFQNSLVGSIWTHWTETEKNPIYNPYSFLILPEDYYPYVVFDLQKFSGHGAAFNYKMWHQGSDSNGSIAVSFSPNGINWSGVTETNLNPPAGHAVVLYDKNKFGVVGGKFYKIWFWTLNESSSISEIRYSESNDGVNWAVGANNSIPITQNPLSPLVTGSGFFAFLRGPGFVIYNPSATSIPGQPYTFPYVMFYDIGQTDQADVQAVNIGLAFSSNGTFWTRYGNAPVFLAVPNQDDWDSTHVFRPSLLQIDNIYHLFYSGSNQNIDRRVTLPDGHGFGHASSIDGINWMRDPTNPILIDSNRVLWRESRTYTPFVLGSQYCGTQLWFVGGSTGSGGGGSDPQLGQNQAIGYATLQCP